VDPSHTLIYGIAYADFLPKFGSRNDIEMKIWNHALDSLKILIQYNALRMIHHRP